MNKTMYLHIMQRQHVQKFNTIILIPLPYKKQDWQQSRSEKYFTLCEYITPPLNQLSQAVVNFGQQQKQMFLQISDIT